MAQEAGARKARRWPSWFSDSTRVAFLGVVIVAVAGVIGAVAAAKITSDATLRAQNSAQRAALRQQEASFQQQRRLADRAELRKVIDQAARNLDTVMTDVDNVHGIWLGCGSRARAKCLSRLIPFPSKLFADLGRVNQVKLRLVLRLRGNSAVFMNLDAAADKANRVVAFMYRFRATGKHPAERDALYLAARMDQDRFSNAARHLLNP